MTVYVLYETGHYTGNRYYLMKDGGWRDVLSRKEADQVKKFYLESAAQSAADEHNAPFNAGTSRRYAHVTVWNNPYR